MVARQILDLLVKVRILVGQQKEQHNQLKYNLLCCF